MVACVDGHPGGPEAVGPQAAVTPSIRIRKCGFGSPGPVPTPAQPRRSSGRQGVSALCPPAPSLASTQFPVVSEP